jgi:hypothetical protein
LCLLVNDSLPRIAYSAARRDSLPAMDYSPEHSFVAWRALRLSIHMFAEPFIAVMK